MRPNNFELNYSHPLARGLVFAGLGAYAGSSRFHDSSLYGNHGTLTSGAVWDGRAVNVKLSTGIELPFTGTQYNNLTIGVWVRSITADSLRYIWDTTGITVGYRMRQDGNSVDCYTYADPTVFALSTTLPLTVGEWTHLTYQFEAGVAGRVYRNGVLDKTTVTASTGIKDGPNDVIGAEWDGDNPYPGLVKDGVMYNRVLSPAEIRILADPSNVMLSGLIRECGDSSNIYNMEGIR